MTNLETTISSLGDELNQVRERKDSIFSRNLTYASIGSLLIASSIIGGVISYSKYERIPAQEKEEHQYLLYGMGASAVAGLLGCGFFGYGFCCSKTRRLDLEERKLTNQIKALNKKD